MNASLARPFTDFQITPVSGAPFFIDELFRIKFNSAAPDYGHGVVAFWRRDRHCFVPVCFINWLPYEEVILVGGGMTDGAALRQVPAAIRAEIDAAGGLFYSVLKYGFARFADECAAYFGYAADPRALKVDLEAGFVHTAHENLIVNWHKPLSARRKRKLVEKVHKIGPF